MDQKPGNQPYDRALPIVTRGGASFLSPRRVFADKDLGGLHEKRLNADVGHSLRSSGNTRRMAPESAEFYGHSDIELFMMPGLANSALKVPELTGLNLQASAAAVAR
jgi:hypothetical protein